MLIQNCCGLRSNLIGNIRSLGVPDSINSPEKEIPCNRGPWFKFSASKFTLRVLLRARSSVWLNRMNWKPRRRQAVFVIHQQSQLISMNVVVKLGRSAVSIRWKKIHVLTKSFSRRVVKIWWFNFILALNCIFFLWGMLMVVSGELSFAPPPPLSPPP